MQDLGTFISNHAYLSIAVVVVFILLIFVELARARKGSFAIGAAEVTKKINHEDAVVLDIRPNDLYKKGHIIGAISMTPREINDNPKKLEKFKTKPIIVVCNVGMESQKIAADLLKNGYNAYSLAGGLRAWTDAQMPLVKD